MMVVNKINEKVEWKVPYANPKSDEKKTFPSLDLNYLQRGIILKAKIEEMDFDFPFFKKRTVSDEYITEGFDYQKYQNELDKDLENAKGTRNKTVAAAKFLATDFPKLPYFWGGGHEIQDINQFKGINEKWGKSEKIVLVGAENSYPVGESFPYSLDCSGFITWCLVNGGYDLKDCLNSTTCKSLGESISMSDPNILDKTKVGDLGHTQGHVGIVIDVDKKDKEITFAHVSDSGHGMGVTTINVETGLITKDSKGAMMSKDRFGNPITADNRVNNEKYKNYFNTIISVPYPD